MAPSVNVYILLILIRLDMGRACMYSPAPGIDMPNISNAQHTDEMTPLPEKDFFTVSLTTRQLADQFSTPEQKVTIADITWGITLVLMFRSVGSIIFGKSQLSQSPSPSPIILIL